MAASAFTFQPLRLQAPVGPKASALTFGLRGGGRAPDPAEAIDVDGQLSMTMIHLRAEQRAYNRDPAVAARLNTTRRDHPPQRRGSYGAARQGGHLSGAESDASQASHTSLAADEDS